VPSGERDDLAAMLARLARRLADAERPLLDAHGLSMWEYIVLSHLARRPVETQLELARGIGYDKTRLIALLDRLESEGLITREPDPADRRARNVRLTKAGERLRAAAQRDIRAMEDEALAPLSATERRTLLAALPRLASTQSGARCGAT
jgi:DNA-binding MarR family transcriptional regulator